MCVDVGSCVLWCTRFGNPNQFFTVKSLHCDFLFDPWYMYIWSYIVRHKIGFLVLLYQGKILSQTHLAV